MNSMTRPHRKSDGTTDRVSREDTGSTIRPAKITGKINNSKATVLWTLAQKSQSWTPAFLVRRNSETRMCGIQENIYTMLGRTTIKVALTRYPVYFFDA
ncbi:hypothetical protein PHMEG_00035982 [Phytophthora megakarya]|uniref:Uncharacterized protein n=1 Tax=Phytophthora megakarya TaxID=4795 RepID=A0A225UMJ4_9STRA|nr:hypothetical protein PHMEG_00035982 [Phytophthora megakarya]